VLSSHAARGGVTVVGATREAADELVREVARHRPATFGMSRFSLAQLAIRVAGPALAARGIAPSTPLGFEAVAARAVFDLQEAEALRTFAGTSSTPGFPPRGGANLGDLGARRVAARRRGDRRLCADDLALVHQTHRGELASRGGRSETLFSAAAVAVAGEPWLRRRWCCSTCSVAIGRRGRVHRRLVAAPPADGHLPPVRPRHPGWRSSAWAAVPLVLERTAGQPTWIICGCTCSPPRPCDASEADGSVEQFSAPGEGRECVEIAAGFCARPRAASPSTTWPSSCGSQSLQGLLEHALARAGVPAWVRQGTRRPHPSAGIPGLAGVRRRTAVARRFAEYLSLGQVPAPSDATTDGSQRGRRCPRRMARPIRPPRAVCPAPRGMERMLVEASVRTRHSGDGIAARPPARRARARDGRGGTRRSRRTTSAGDQPRLTRLESLAAFRAAAHRRARGLAAAGHVGRVARPARTGGAARGRGDGPVLGVLSDLRPMARVGR
jgi:hypothetical protein